MSQDLLSPPKNLVEQWKAEAFQKYGCANDAYELVLARAAAWGHAQACEEMQTILGRLKEE